MQGNIGINKRKDYVALTKSMKIPARTTNIFKDPFYYDFKDDGSGYKVKDKKEYLGEDLSSTMNDLKSRVNNLYENLEDAFSSIEKLKNNAKGFDKMKRNKCLKIKDTIKNMNISKREIKLGAGIILASGIVSCIALKSCSNRY